MNFDNNAILNYLGKKLIYFRNDLNPDLLFKIKSETVKFLFNVSVVIEKQDVDENKMTQTIKKTKKIPRNSPCTCGSGKKYKHCHGRIV